MINLKSAPRHECQPRAGPHWAVLPCLTYNPSRSPFRPTAIFHSRLVWKGHRRLLEHLTDPACPSIRGFVQSFGDEAPLSAGGREENPAKPAGNPENGDPGSLGHGDHHSTAGNDRAEKATKCQVASTAEELRDSYNGCLSALRDFR